MASKNKPGTDRRRCKDVWTRNCILILCCLGISLSAYACYVEISKERDGSYKALCDISDRISCSKVFTSRWGRGFGLIELLAGRESWLNQPNSVFGMAFYAFQTTLAFNPTRVAATVGIVSSVMANMGSIYLGYILVVILKDVCIVCISTYVLNLMLLLCCVCKYKQLPPTAATHKKTM